MHASMTSNKGRVRETLVRIPASVRVATNATIATALKHNEYDEAHIADWTATSMACARAVLCDTQLTWQDVEDMQKFIVAISGIYF